MNIKNVGLIILVILVFLLIIGSVSNTSNNNTTDDSPNSPKINASGENMTFFGMNTPIGEEGYQYATFDENDTIYYMTYDQAELVAKLDPNTREVYNWDLEQTGNEGVQYAGTTVGSSGINHILSYQPREHETVQFQYPRGGDFVFTAHQKEVLGNENAMVIDKLFYPNGTEITSDDNNTVEYIIN